MSERTDWIIIDRSIVDLLRKDGFTCHHEPDKPWNVWYSTNVPIEYNKSYVLSNGLTLYSSGTSLHLAGQKPLHKMTEEELAQLQKELNAEWEREQQIIDAFRLTPEMLGEVKDSNLPNALMREQAYRKLMGQ